MYSATAKRARARVGPTVPVVQVVLQRSEERFGDRVVPAHRGPPEAGADVFVLAVQVNTAGVTGSIPVSPTTEIPEIVGLQADLTRARARHLPDRRGTISDRLPQQRAWDR
jgi:hypothetical protein